MYLPQKFVSTAKENIYSLQGWDPSLYYSNMQMNLIVAPNLTNFYKMIDVVYSQQVNGIVKNKAQQPILGIEMVACSSRE